jgi:uncharacterized protein (TIGR02145 family)
MGICPEGWHVPTGDPNGEFRALYNAGVNDIGEWSDGTTVINTNAYYWHGVRGGFCTRLGEITNTHSNAYYLSSSWSANNYVYILAMFFNVSNVTPDNGGVYTKYNGYSVRCVRNY